MIVRRTFSAALFRPLLWAVVVVLLISAGGSFLLTQSIVRKGMQERFKGTHALFSQMITSSLLAGAYPDVYRRCQNLSHSRGIVAVEVTTADGYVVCAERNAEPSSREIPVTGGIFFDEQAIDKAASVKVIFRDDIGGALIRQAGYFFGISILLLLTLGWMAGRLLAHRLSRPLTELSNTIASGDLAILSDLDRDSVGNEVEETFVLKTSVSTLAHHLLESRKNLIETAEKAALSAFAVQVAHDIRSPLAALDIASRDISQMPEDKRVLVRAAICRIRDIANGLLERYRAHPAAAPESVSPQLLSGLLEPVVSEKRLQFRSQSAARIEALLTPSSYGLFAAVPPGEFKRILSNLINNAVEALNDGAGAVNIELAMQDGMARMNIRDDGRGIPADVLAKLGRRGETHGKTGGSGLGLYHARACAESWGGRLDIASEVGKGTTVTIALPLAPAPDWFVPQLTLPPGRPVMILDDDPSIHQVWQGRLDALKAGAQGVEVAHASTPQELRAWVAADATRAREALYLLDYELAGHAETGLSLAEELGIGERAILVTSRHEEPAVVEGCRRLKARLIPKGLAGLVPMHVEASAAASPMRERWDAVLIDDDALARATWELAAKRLGKRLRAFPTPAEFFAAADAIDRGTPVYVDSELGEGVQGAEESRRVHELGFSEVYLATGHEPGRFAVLAHLRGVIGKAPPWA